MQSTRLYLQRAEERVGQRVVDLAAGGRERGGIDGVARHEECGAVGLALCRWVVVCQQGQIIWQGERGEGQDGGLGDGRMQTGALAALESDAAPSPSQNKRAARHHLKAKQTKAATACANKPYPQPPPQHAPSTRTHLEADRLQKLHRAGHDRDARLERRVAEVDAAELLLVGRARDVAFYLNFEFEMF